MFRRCGVDRGLCPLDTHQRSALDRTSLRRDGDEDENKDKYENEDEDDTNTSTKTRPKAGLKT